jgi:hypothetical protein
LEVAAEKLPMVASRCGVKGFDVRQQAALTSAEALTLTGHGMSRVALLTSAVMAINACRLGAVPSIANSAAAS